MSFSVFHEQKCNKRHNTDVKCCRALQQLNDLIELFWVWLYVCQAKEYRGQCLSSWTWEGGFSHGAPYCSAHPIFSSTVSLYPQAGYLLLVKGCMLTLPCDHHISGCLTFYFVLNDMYNGCVLSSHRECRDRECQQLSNNKHLFLKCIHLQDNTTLHSWLDTTHPLYVGHILHAHTSHIARVTHPWPHNSIPEKEVLISSCISHTVYFSGREGHLNEMLLPALSYTNLIKHMHTICHHCMSKKV